MEPCLNWRRYFFDSGGTAPLKKKQTSTAIAQLQQYWIYWHLKTSHEEETDPQEETQHLFIIAPVLYFNVRNNGLKLGAVPVHRISPVGGSNKDLTAVDGPKVSALPLADARG